MQGSNTIRRALAACIAAPVFMAWSVAASADDPSGWQFGVGIERYGWKEYPAGTTITPKESGDRLALFLGWEPDDRAGAYLRYVGKIYGGTVNYNTATMLTNVPVTTTTDYLGMANEAQGIIPVARFMSIVAGLGYDYWKRAIADGVTATGLFVQGYSESWGVVYLRLGVAADIRGMVQVGGGIKHTVQNTEDTNFFGTIHPGQSTSPYLDLSYRINATSSVGVYYDSYRFAQSAVNGLGYYQPKSNMDTIGIRLMVNT